MTARVTPLLDKKPPTYEGNDTYRLPVTTLPEIKQKPQAFTHRSASQSGGVSQQLEDYVKRTDRIYANVNYAKQSKAMLTERAGIVKSGSGDLPRTLVRDFSRPVLADKVRKV